jgi:hypothetical protein
MIRKIVAGVLCSLMVSQAAAAQTPPLRLALQAANAQSVSGPAADDPAPPGEPVQVDPSEPFVPSTRPDRGGATLRAVGGALMTVGGIAGLVALSCLLSSVGITGTDESGQPVAPPADPKTLQTVGVVSLGIAAVGLMAGLTVIGVARDTR